MAIFRGTFGDLEKFVPKKLTLRQVVSKVATIFDIRGLLAPIIGSLRLDTRKTCKMVLGWDDPMPDLMREKWIQNFWCLEQLRGLGFRRAMMPENAANSRARAITAVDAALEMLMMAVYICFELIGGGWSCQLLIARAMLASKTGTIPKNELQSLCNGSNLGWTVVKSLDDWVDSKIVCTDSAIAIHWTMSENLPLSIFHKNRVIQILRGTDTSELFHVKSEYNPADVGTRPDKVSIDDVMPDSVFQTGYEWMRKDLAEAEEDGHITPARKLRLKPEDKADFDQGLLFDPVPEILTRGHASTETPEKVEEGPVKVNSTCYTTEERTDDSFASVLPLSWKEYQALAVIHYGNDWEPKASLDKSKKNAVLEMRRNNTIQKGEEKESLEIQTLNLKPDRA